MGKSLITYQYSAFKMNGFYFFLVWRLLPTHCSFRGLLLRLITLSDTHTHTHARTRTHAHALTHTHKHTHTHTHTHTLDRTSVDERSVRRRDSLRVQHTTCRTDRHPCKWLDSNPNPSKPVLASDPRLRPRSHGNRHNVLYPSSE
jgi:hypothetical protein